MLEDDEVGGSVGFEVVTVDPLPPINPAQAGAIKRNLPQATGRACGV